MASLNSHIEWKTDPLTQFRAAIAQDAGTDLDLEMSGAAAVPNPTALAGVGGDCRGLLKSLTIISVENLAWELWVWRKAAHGTVTLGTVSVIGKFTFSEADGRQIAGAGDYYYYVDDIDLPVTDDDKTGKLHLTLVNRSIASKTVDDAGAVQVRGRIAQPIY